MNVFTVRFSWKKLQRILRKVHILGVILGLISLFSGIGLCFPETAALDHLYEQTLQVDMVKIRNTSRILGRGISGSGGLELQIICGSDTFYCSYDQYGKVAEIVEAD